MEVKYCPQCGKISDPGQALCDCGYGASAKPRVPHEIPPYKPIGSPPRYNLARMRILGLSLVVVAAAVGVLAIFNLNGATSEDKETAQTTAVPAASQLASKVEPGGNSAVDGEFDGVVTRIVTGDAIAVRDMRNTEHLVKLADIVAPKLNDNFGKEARENLSGVLLGKSVRVRPFRNENGVIYGRVMRDGTNVGLEQIRGGFAAQNPLMELADNERRVYAEAEAGARNARLGVWSASAEQPASAPASELASVPVAGDPAAVPGVATAVPAPPPPAASTMTKNEIAERRGETQLFSPPPVPARTENQPTSPSRNIAPAKETASSPDPVPSASEPRSVLPAGPKASSTPADTSTARKYILGPRGGCYYLNAKGSKSYVDRSLCQ